MSNIEVEEYIRTRQGKIDKVEEIKTISTKMDGNHIYGYKLKNNNAYWIEKEWIVKHSKNIIDLIEVGDYLNGTKITNIDNYDGIYTIEWEYGNVYTTEIINDKFIKTILTHEQYEQNSYKIGE